MTAACFFFSFLLLARGPFAFPKWKLKHCHHQLTQDKEERKALLFGVWLNMNKVWVTLLVGCASSVLGLAWLRSEPVELLCAKLFWFTLGHSPRIGGHAGAAAGEGGADKAIMSHLLSAVAHTAGLLVLLAAQASVLVTCFSFKHYWPVFLSAPLAALSTLAFTTIALGNICPSCLALFLNLWYAPCVCVCVYVCVFVCVCVFSSSFAARDPIYFTLPVPPPPSFPLPVPPLSLSFPLPPSSSLSPSPSLSLPLPPSLPVVFATRPCPVEPGFLCLWQCWQQQVLLQPCGFVFLGFLALAAGTACRGATLSSPPSAAPL